MTPNSKFRLTKWYADCVGHDGDVVILYCGIARWRAITLRYTSVLEAGSGRKTVVRYSLRRSTMPAKRGTSIRWQSNSLGIMGVWERLDPPFETEVYKSSEGVIKWHCLHPRSRASINLGCTKAVQGLGYVERLDMTLAPWTLPIQELRWGRFLNDSNSLVWLDWKGSYTCRLVLQNGILGRATVIDDDGITLNGNSGLRLTERDVLRNGALGRTALAIIPGLKRFFPSKILKVRECKWRSRGELRRGDSRSSGWAIHEVIRWRE